MTNKQHDVSIFIITRDNEYICLDEYDVFDNTEGVFVCLTNEQLNPEYGRNNSICIHKDWKNKSIDTFNRFKYLLKDNIQFDHKSNLCAMWQSEQRAIPNNIIYRPGFESFENEYMDTIYLNGQMSCQNIMSNVTPLLKGKTKEEYIPAIMLAYHTCVEFNGVKYHGYLPSIGQMVYIFKYLTSVNHALDIIGSVITIEKNDGLRWWTSTEQTSDSIICTAGISAIYGLKDNIHRIMTLFPL